MVNDKYEGMIVKGVLTPASLTFPKDPWEDVEVGQFAIFKATIESISSLESTTANDLPYQITSGWVPPYSGVVFKGKVPGISPYSQYIFKAKLVVDQRYGYQFNLITMDRVAEISDEAEFQTFCDAIFTERAATLLREAFPTNLKKVLDSSDCKEQLKMIKGIGSITAAHILETYEQNKAYYKDFVVLHGKYGLTQKAISRLKEKFGSTEALVKTLEENPYVLMEEDGYGWIKCDALALASGYNPLGEFRVQAYIKYFLQTQAESNGHSWVTLDVLVQAIKDNIGDVNLKLLQMWLQTWTNKENNPKIRPWLYYEKETRRIGLMYLRNLENSIAKDLYRLQTAKPLVSFTEEEIDWAISESEISQGWEYTDEQRKAIIGCLTNGVTIVTGSGGSGKTSIMLPIAKLLRSKGVPFGQCSLAGKAASNLSEVTNVEGKTIHRLLGFDPETHGFSCNRDNPLLERVIILDELSMVGAELFYDLIQAIPSGAKLIMLGDSQQLEAIGYANLLKDCVDSHVVPCYKLTKIHRQAQRSAIITESLKVADGKQIIGNSAINEVRGELQDLKIVTYHESEESFNEFMHEYKELLGRGISFKDILGVVPMRTRGSISCLNLNKEIQSIVNGSYEIPHINIRKPDGVYDIKVGDKVVNRKNRYDTEKFTVPKDFISIDDDRYTEKVAIFNGNVGYVTKVMIGGIVIDFLQQGEVFVKSEYTDSIELGYVLTAHSAQGSQAPNVIVGIDMSAYTLLSKEWIYTAITRARKYCVLCGQISAIKKATSISRVKVKQTWLTELLRQNFQQ
mgnify:CR=1 FL=1